MSKMDKSKKVGGRRNKGGEAPASSQAGKGSKAFAAMKQAKRFEKTRTRTGKNYTCG